MRKKLSPQRIDQKILTILIIDGVGIGLKDIL